MAENTSTSGARQEQTDAQAASAVRDEAYDAPTQAMPSEDASRLSASQVASRPAAPQDSTTPQGIPYAGAPYDGSSYAGAPYTEGAAPQEDPYPNGAVPATSSVQSAPPTPAGKGAKKPADPQRKERRKLVAFVIIASLVCGLVGGVAGAAIFDRIDGSDDPTMQTPDGSGGMQMPGNGSGGMQRPGGGSGMLQMPGDGSGSDSDSSGSGNSSSGSSTSEASNSAQESSADAITA